MASCSNEVLDSVVPQEPQAISFENPFLDKGTRANVNDMVVDQNFTKFYVYGATGNGSSANLYNGTEITKYNGVWTSVSNPKYWENANYFFVAYTNGNEQIPNEDETISTTVTYLNKDITISNYVNTGDKDLIVSEKVAIEGTTSRTEPVSLTFGHKLAKVFFTFTTDAVAGQELTVSDIKLSGVKSTGTYATSNNQWSEQNVESHARDYVYTGNVVVTPSSATGGNVASASSIEKYMIPQTVEESTFIVSFTATLKDLTTKKSETKSFTVKLPATPISSWEVNNIYNYTAKITRKEITLGNPITFTPEVSSWGKTNDGGNTTKPELVE